MGLQPIFVLPSKESSMYIGCDDTRLEHPFLMSNGHDGLNGDISLCAKVFHLAGNNE
jgi:hypothetical protein